MKRKRSGQVVEVTSKRPKLANTQSKPQTWLLLQQYYPDVQTLRDYLVSQIPATSKHRRRRLIRYGLEPSEPEACADDENLVQLLDNVIVASHGHSKSAGRAPIERDLVVFTQQLSEPVVTNNSTQLILAQPEVGGSIPVILTTRSFHCS